MKANKVRARLSNIQQSYPGHMDEMMAELDALELRAEIGDACVWAFKECIQEGSAVEGATEQLVKRYRNAIAERKERLEFEKWYREANNPIGKDVESEGE